MTPLTESTMNGAQKSLLANLKIGIIGAGTLGKAMMVAWIESGILQPNQIYASTGHDISLAKLKNDHPWLLNGHLSLDNDWVAQQVDLVFLCVKPDKVRSVMEHLSTAVNFSTKTLISIVAGVNLDQLHLYFSQDQPKTIIRAVPNVASRIRHGITCISYQSSKTKNDVNIELIISLFDTVGNTYVFEEKHLNSAIALGASSPAFVTVMIEAMTDGALAMGIPRSTALKMSLQSMIGTCQLILNNHASPIYDNEANISSQKMKHPSEVRESITTPGGCTIAGLLTLEECCVRSGISKAIQKTTLFLNERDSLNAIKK